MNARTMIREVGRRLRRLPAPVLPVAAAVAAGTLLLSRRSSASTSADGASVEVTTPDAIAGLAFPWLVAWPAADRQVLVDVAKRLNIDPTALSTIFHLESGGDPSVPKQESGTPRAGLIQITVGARMPGLDSAAMVWAVRSWSARRQMLEVVEPFFARYKGRSPGWGAFHLYKLNFLPGVASKGDDFVIARDGSSEPLIQGVPLTLGAIYANNRGFDSGGKGYFTWGDVRRKVEGAQKAGKGQVVTVSGQIRQAPPMRRIDPRGTAANVPREYNAPDMGIRLREVAWT